MHDEMAEFLAALLHSGTITHFMHWATPSRSDHTALGEYYEKIINKVDKLAESYMGRYKKLTKFPSDFHMATEPLEYMEGLQSFVAEARQSLPQDTELQNRIDEIAELINTTVYELRELE